MALSPTNDAALLQEVDEAVRKDRLDTIMQRFGRWIVGGAIWLIGHLAAVWAAKRDPAFVDVVRRHLRYPQHLVA